MGPGRGDARARARAAVARRRARRARRAAPRCSRRSPSSPIRRRRRVTIDLGDVRGFDYYTGVRFAGYASGAPDAVLRGGRYDELIGRYGRAGARDRLRDRSRGARGGAARGRGRARPAFARARGARPRRRGIARALRSRGMRAVVCAAPHRPRAGCAGPGLDAAVVHRHRRRRACRRRARDRSTSMSLESADRTLEVRRCPS